MLAGSLGVCGVRGTVGGWRCHGPSREGERGTRTGPPLVVSQGLSQLQGPAELEGIEAKAPGLFIPTSRGYQIYGPPGQGLGLWLGPTVAAGLQPALLDTWK